MRSLMMAAICQRPVDERAEFGSPEPTGCPAWTPGNALATMRPERSARKSVFCCAVASERLWWATGT
jgi:hypothetical protein